MASPTASQLIEADDQLRTVFSHFYCVQHSEQAPAIQQQLVPSYEMLLIFNFGPDIPFHLGTSNHVVRQVAAVGPLQKMARYELPPGADMIVVNFTHNGFHRLLGTPIHQLKTADWQNPEALLDENGLYELWQQLASMPTLADKLQLISTYMLAHVAPADDATNLLMDTIPYFSLDAVDPIKAVAEAHQVSTRSIQIRFQTHLGYSAKELARFLRFKRLIAFLVEQHPLLPDWSDLVLQYGYHDQSHLIKDFQHFMSMTPKAFVRQLAQDELCIIKICHY